MRLMNLFRKCYRRFEVVVRRKRLLVTNTNNVTCVVLCTKRTRLVVTLSLGLKHKHLKTLFVYIITSYTQALRVSINALLNATKRISIFKLVQNMCLYCITEVFQLCRSTHLYDAYINLYVYCVSI